MVLPKTLLAQRILLNKDSSSNKKNFKERVIIVALERCHTKDYLFSFWSAKQAIKTVQSVKELLKVRGFYLRRFI